MTIKHTNNCSSCDYLELNDVPQAHCYMFKTEPPVCRAHSKLEKNKNIPNIYQAINEFFKM